MDTLKEKALELRKQGNSYLQIHQILGVPKSTLSLWLHNIKLDDDVVEKIYKRGRKKSIEALVKRNKRQTENAKNRAQSIRKKFAKEIDNLTQKELFYLGLGLYLGEGYKRGADGAKWKCVDIANSDPDIIRIMMRFFRESCSIKDNEFRLFLSLHEEKMEKETIEYWISQTGLQKENFIKTSFVVAKSSLKKYSKRLNNGTLHIRVYNTDFFHKIIGWIDGIRNIV